MTKPRIRTRKLWLLPLAVLALAACSQPDPKPPPPIEPVAAEGETLTLQGFVGAYEECKHEALGDAHGLSDCHAAMMGATRALIPKTRGNLLLHDLLEALFEPLKKARAAPGSMEIEREINTAVFADFARQRVEILTGVSTIAPADGPTRRQLTAVLDQLNKDDASHEGTFDARWTTLRNDDCAAYPVAQCAERLDAAFLKLLTDLGGKP